MSATSGEIVLGRGEGHRKKPGSLTREGDGEKTEKQNREEKEI